MCEHCRLLVHLNCANVPENRKFEDSKTENYLYITKMCYLWTKKRRQMTTTPTNMSKNFRNSKQTSVYAILIHNQWPQFMIKESKFDIITLSKTLLKNGKYLLEYVNLPDYKFSYRNRDKKRDGGVGVYIRLDYIQN